MAELVRPGEIISADFMNSLLGRIEALETRDDVGQHVRIDSLEPTLGRIIHGVVEEGTLRHTRDIILPNI